MSYYRFGRDDVLINRIKTYPRNSFTIYSGSVFYNNTPYESGSIAPTNVTLNPVGSVSLYELNVDRPEDLDTYNWETGAGTIALIRPFIVKGSSGMGFSTITTGSYNATDYGTRMTSSYPLSASIARQYFGTNQSRFVLTTKQVFLPELNQTQILTVSSSHIDALKNTLNYYTYLSDQYAYTASANVSDGTPQWDKGTQELNFINIPSIFCGSGIKKGSLDIKFYVSGTLAAQCKDIYKNGNLIEVSGTYDRFESGSVAGVVLYNEGIVLLTGSWALSPHTEKYNATTAVTNPTWAYWGTGIPKDGSGSLNLPSSSYSMEFEGTNHTPVITMFAHAPRGQLNFSNNPTFTVVNTASAAGDTNASFSGSMQGVMSGSAGYTQDPAFEIKNVVSSSFPNGTGSFAKTTYISKVGVYDKNKNLIGIAKLAKPIKKTATQDFTFKLKLDI
jgi:hypothetical protein